MKKTKLAAFTLLECLLALVVISGSLLVFEGLTKLIVHEVQYQEQRMDKNWLVFCDQLRREWEGASLDVVEMNRIVVTKDGKNLAFGKSRADDFRKTNAKGQGYQPMLYHVQSAHYLQTNHFVELKIVFDNGEEKTFVYDFEKTG